VNLVLVRHGEAGDAPVDDHRALTATGRRHVRRVGQVLVAQPEPIDVILTSPLVRAVQTAEVIAGALGLDEQIHARPEIAFPARLEQILAVVDEVPGSVRGVLVVGHEPTMGVLTRHLFGATGPSVSFRTGTAVSMSWTRGRAEATPRYAVMGNPPERLDL